MMEFSINQLTIILAVYYFDNKRISPTWMKQLTKKFIQLFNADCSSQNILYSISLFQNLDTSYKAQPVKLSNENYSFLWNYYILEDRIKLLKEIYSNFKKDIIIEQINNPLSIETESEYVEGSTIKINVNKYERNPDARKKCIELLGSKCLICGFDFEKEYGELGKNFIHVHHLVPLSKIKKNYVVNPKTDLIPVCPNCHAMIHRHKNIEKLTNINEIKKALRKL